MTDRDAILAAVRDRPDDDTPRLVYADFLDDQGDEAMSLHASFVRRQVEASRAGRGCVSWRWKGKGTRLSSMCSELWAWGDEWPPPSPLFLRNAGGTGVVWHRGFLEAVAAGPNDWLRIGHEVCQRHPALRLVHLILRPADYYTLGDRPERFSGATGGGVVARRLGWTVRLPPGGHRASGTWADLARHDARVFFEAIFPGVSFVADPAVPVTGYPATPRPERVAVRATVTPPAGVWPNGPPTGVT